jgi:hypothetical protein
MEKLSDTWRKTVPGDQPAPDAGLLRGGLNGIELRD